MYIYCVRIHIQRDGERASTALEYNAARWCSEMTRDDVDVVADSYVRLNIESQLVRGASRMCVAVSEISSLAQVPDTLDH